MSKAFPSRTRLERALRVVAQIVQADATYLPIFERLEQELAQLDRHEQALARARDMTRPAPDVVPTNFPSHS